jgi:serine/threonine protein kinase
MVAVKKLFNRKTMDEGMFQQEVTTMLRVKHKNIVRFVGYCSHTEQQAVKIMTRKHILADERERLLCFDYISKGCLEDHVNGMEKTINYSY